jgi:ADP-ribose diphosphatase
MPGSRKCEVRKQTRLFDDDFCKLDELIVSHMRNDGSMSADQRRIIFERGDAAAVLLFNTDTRCVVLVNQFRAPTLGKGIADGWITETMAGTIDKPESPIRTAIRETMEETGYEVNEPTQEGAEQDGDLRLIAKFFSSPGGSSELIYLYFAKVSNAKKKGNGGGVGTEDIAVQEFPVDELFRMIKLNRIEDPKVLIGALWLQEELKENGRKPLASDGVEYPLVKHPELFIGYKTGPIHAVNNVSIWVNSENEDMIMDRFNGKTISSSVRFLGASKDAAGNLTEDTVNDELTNAIGQQAPVRIGTVFETGSGNLETTHGVNKILHVATVRGARFPLGYKADLGTRAAVPVGFKADPDDLVLCVNNVLDAAHRSNLRLWRRVWRRSNSDSILIPMIGAGDGGLRIDQAVPKLVEAALGYLQANPKTTVKKVYFLAYTAAHKDALDQELKKYCGKVIDG